MTSRLRPACDAPVRRLVVWLVLFASIGTACGTTAAGDDDATPDERSARATSEPDSPAAAVETTTAAVDRDLFVAGWGSDDGPGTADEPFRTLAAALPRLRAGDTLTVREGTYDEDIVLERELAPGRADAPIVVQAAAGERPVIEGRLALYDADHWHFRGINVTWSDRNDSDEHMVVFNGGVGFRFSHAEVWGARSFAAIVTGYGSRDFRLDNLYVHHTYAANDANQDHLIYLSSDSTGGVVERNVLAHSPNGRGVKIGPGSLSEPGASGNTIRYNTFFANEGPSNIQLSGDSSDNEIYGNLFVQAGPDSEAITAWQLDGTDNVVRDNLVWDVAGVLEADDGLVDGGGNVVLDPELAAPGDDDFRPTNPVAQEFGALAGR